MTNDLYSAAHRALQDEFDTRRMADLMQQVIMHDAFDDMETGFVSSRSFFFLSTVDPAGEPTVSYKGGAPGFVRVVDPHTLVFPSYDGNGMFYSMGNIAATARVGLLFIDFETPHRLRVQGAASILRDDPLAADYPEAQFLVCVAVDRIFVNCPRYVHRHQRIETSKYVPTVGCETPIPAWKRIDVVQPALPARDQGRAEAAGGLITMEEYGARLLAGDA